MNKKWKKCIALLLICLLMTEFMEIPVRADASGGKKYVAREQIKNVCASSYAEGYEPEKAIDGIQDNPDNCWHTPWSDNHSDFPHWIQVEFTKPQMIDSFFYIARDATEFQFVTSYEIWVSADAEEQNLQKIAEGTWKREKSVKAEFLPVSAVLVRFVAKDKVDSNSSDNYSVSASEIKFGLAEMDMEQYKNDIVQMQMRIQRVLSYIKKDMGKEPFQFSEIMWQNANEQIDRLQKVLESGNAGDVRNALAEAEAVIEQALSSNKAENEPLTNMVPCEAMHASANTENIGYEAENAVDGEASTMWHSQWEPETTERPHELLIDLGEDILLEQVILTPRQDMDSCRISDGELWIGDDPGNLEFVTDFQMRDITNIPIDYREAHYIQIKALAGEDDNTAIGEVAVLTYDRGYAAMWNAYIDAVNVLKNAETGDDIGQYSLESKENFEKLIQKYSVELENSHKNSECCELAEEITQTKENFIDQVRRYQREDLEEFIVQARILSEKLDKKDQELLMQAIEDAESVVTAADSTAMQIHETAVALKETMDMLRVVESSCIDLSGNWELRLGAYEADGVFSDRVKLPGTLDENKKGTYNDYRDSERLSRYYTYTGAAAYQRQVFIPNSWENKQISLFMERSRETRVWVNETEVWAPDSSNVLAVPQRYDLTQGIRHGELNTITVEVDNSYPNMPKDAILESSMATEETQTNWNGIVGKIELQVNEQIAIDDLRVYPNKDLQSVTVEVDVKNNTAALYVGEITVQAEDRLERKIPVSVKSGEMATVSVNNYALGKGIDLWGEFEQNLYTMNVSLENGSQMTETFGMRIFSIDASTKQLTNNGNKIFVRGEANCAVFPLTGYAPMEEAEWEKLFSNYQSYGINTVRFHSWCPPEAAFDAADRMGLYLQPELSCWDARNMFGDWTEKEYYAKEAKAIIKEYANHPSFVMLTFGNELHFADGGYEYADQLIQELKKQDCTRLYSFASNSDYGSTGPTANSDFFTGQVYEGTVMRGIYAGMGGFINQRYPSTVINYADAVDRAKTPVFSFEVGQFQVFPDILSELDKYTGVLEPRNLQMVEEHLEDLNISREATKRYIEASGMLSRLGYRMEIEAALRTENMSGISLLGIQDFSGQHTALVGMMNALGEPKPYDFAEPEAFSAFFSPEVALLETEKFSWTNAEKFTGKLLLANYGPDDINGEMDYRMTDGDKVIAEGKLKAEVFTQGQVTEAGRITIPLSEISEAKQLKLTVGLGNIKNDYDIWVYPVVKKVSEGDVYITEYLDEEALSVLEDGGKVLLEPRANKEALPNSITGTFTTAFWSSQFISESQPGSMGLLMDPKHPVFKEFPTDYYSNYQWWAMAKLGRPMILENLTQKDGSRIQPLVQVIDSFSTIRTMGLLYEAKIGEGKLMVSSMGLEQLKGRYPEAMALRNSILKYMNSESFDPQFETDVEKIKESVIEETESEPQMNLAVSSNGGRILLGENTKTCQKGYDNDPQDRATELNDGRIDVETPSRSWTDWNEEGEYPNDVELTAIFDDLYLVDMIELPFFEDSGCKAPKSVQIQYETENGIFQLVDNPSQTTGFGKGSNVITFDAVKTNKIKVIMEHQERMGIALSEFIVYEKIIPAKSIEIIPENDQKSVRLGETLVLGISYEPEEANDRNVRWKALDRWGNKADNARISLSGVLTPLKTGTVYVQAVLRSNEKVRAMLEITILEKENEKPERTENPEKPENPEKVEKPENKKNVTGTEKTYDVNGVLRYKVTKSSNGTATVVKMLKKNKKKIVIPATVKIDGCTFKVTTIAENAFEGCKKLKSVTIGKNVTDIEQKAFFKCIRLKMIRFKGKKAPKIGRQAFKGIQSKCRIAVQEKMMKKQLKILKKRMKKAGMN